MAGWLIVVCLSLRSVEAATSNSSPDHLVWPPPPDPARIRYVESWTRPADMGFKQGFFRRFSNWVTGSRKGNEMFQTPFAVALDERGRMIMSDTATATVGFYDRVEKKWYQWREVGGTRFRSPVGVAKQDKVLYVADSELRQVLAFDLKGRLQFSIKEHISRPVGLCVASGRLWVADVGLQAVCVFDLKGNFLFQFGQRGAGPGEFNYPTHVAAGSDGRIFVTDALNGRIQVFDGEGKFLNVIGCLGDGMGCLARPKGLAVNSFGHVYVVDGLKDLFQIYSAQNRFLLAVGSSGASAGQFCMPAGVAAGTNQFIYVADSGNHRIQVFQYIDSP